MTDCFFVAVRYAILPEALQVLQVAIMEDIEKYRDRLHAKDKGLRGVYDMLVHFEIQSYTIMPEMVPVQGSLLAAGTQQQFSTQYTVVALVVVNDTRAK